MIVLIKDGAKEEQVRQLIERLESFGFQVHVSKGVVKTILGLVGNTARLDIDLIRSMEIVQDVKRVQEPYKNANRKFHPEDTVITVGGVTIGGGSRSSSRALLRRIRRADLQGGLGRSSGAGCLGRLQTQDLALLLPGPRRGGDPAAAPGQGGDRAAHRHGDHGPGPVGFSLTGWMFRSVPGTCRTTSCCASWEPRGSPSCSSGLFQHPGGTADERGVHHGGGNEQVILCERGIRTLETATRNTLDLSAVPVLKQLSHLPVVIDPSHSTGMASLVRPMSLSAIAAGADGLDHRGVNDLPHALSDGLQSPTPEPSTTWPRRRTFVFRAVLPVRGDDAADRRRRASATSGAPWPRRRGVSFTSPGPGARCGPSTERAALEEGAIDGVLDEEAPVRLRPPAGGPLPGSLGSSSPDHAQELVLLGLLRHRPCGIKAPGLRRRRPIARRRVSISSAATPWPGRGPSGLASPARPLRRPDDPHPPRTPRP